MKIYLTRSIFKPISLLFFFITLINLNEKFLSAEELYLKEMQINSSTKLDGKRSDFPKNPFEIVDMLRRASSLNEATNPSDAIDDALKSFNVIDQNENL